MSRKIPKFWGLHAEPPPHWQWLLAILPFVIALTVYFWGSHERLSVNPQDKILPSLAQMIEATRLKAFVPDKRTGEYLLWKDTFSSLKRIGAGMALSASFGLFLGLNMGMFVSFRYLVLPFVTFLSIIPPMSLLPILFITFGVEEMGKIMLIFIGTFPLITRDIYQSVSQTPREQITKALTLGATPLEVVYGIVLPQVMPRLIDTVRLSLGAAWMFLIASEAIASEDGLGYRIFLVRRFLAMDVIIPYALWITFIGFVMDFSLRRLVTWRYKWYVATK